MSIQTRPQFMRAQFQPADGCGPLDAAPFILSAVVSGDGLRCLWRGACWVHDPNGCEVLVKVLLTEFLSGDVFLRCERCEDRATPIMIRLGAFVQQYRGPGALVFATGPSDLLACGSPVSLSAHGM